MMIVILAFVIVRFDVEIKLFAYIVLVVVMVRFMAAFVLVVQIVKAMVRVVLKSKCALQFSKRVHPVISREGAGCTNSKFKMHTRGGCGVH
jgi:hypothetical protein